MANKEFDDLTAADKLTGAEIIAVTQGGNSRQTTAEKVKGMGIVRKVVAGSGTYAAVAGDSDKYLVFTAGSAITLEISDGIFAAGDELTFEQNGTGLITVSEGGTMTINSRGGRYDTNGQFAVASLKFHADDDATLFGDLV
jgi:hypothetical protein